MSKSTEEKVGHTPGPWKATWNGREDGKSVGSVYSEPRRGHAYSVARCPQYQTEEQWRADSALITAAPELLATLKAITDAYASACARLEEEYGDDPNPPDLVAARAAIAKAEGRA